jgi:hypothetical protein
VRCALISFIMAICWVDCLRILRNGFAGFITVGFFTLGLWDAYDHYQSMAYTEI